MQLSADLEAVTGKGPMSRGEVVKKLWDYIKKNNLQNPANKRNILADDKLKKVFGGKGEVTMFEMTKLVSAHLKEAMARSRAALGPRGFCVSRVGHGTSARPRFPRRCR